MPIKKEVMVKIPFLEGTIHFMNSYVVVAKSDKYGEANFFAKREATTSVRFYPT